MDRIHSFDYLKGLALFFVVLIHAKPYVDMGGLLHNIGIALLNLARFAVPCFFLISGYLFRKKLARKESKYALNYLRKLVKAYGKATAAFLILNIFLIFAYQYLGFQALEKVIIFNLTGLEGLISLVYFGNSLSYHLWFLPALAISITVLYFFHKVEKVHILLPASYVAHLIGVASGAYNLFSFPSQPRDPLFFGLFFVTCGYYISKKNLGKVLEFYTTLKLFLLFSALQVAEGVLISTYMPAVDVASLDYSLFTAPMALMLFLSALSRPGIGKNTRLMEYGRRSLWIYIMHPIILFPFIAAVEIVSLSTGGKILFRTLMTPLASFLTAEFVLRYR